MPAAELDLSIRPTGTDVANSGRSSIGLHNISVVIPMLNEQDSIGLVLADLPNVRCVFVVDNGSTDDSARLAAAAGASVLSEPQRGYGKACLTGIAAVNEFLQDSPDVAADHIIVFVDGDYSDHPDELPRLIEPIFNDGFDFVIGSRLAGHREQGSMYFQAIFGNRLACFLMRLFWGAQFSDLGPFRAIRLSALNALNMRDQNFGWTIEMQIKAVRQGLRYTEVPVSYRRRVGVSKISGTISGTLKAGWKILYTVFKFRLGLG